MIAKQGLLVAFLCTAGASQAALFSGSSFFSVAPISGIGSVTNSLTLTDTGTGFIVSGQVLVNTAPGSASGTLCRFEVSRALDPTFGSALMTTTTQVIGYSAPPTGTFGNTSGNCRSYFTNFLGLSESLVPLTLPGGTNTWSLTTTSSPFVYTSGGTNYLTQVFDVDGVQLSGPGGVWTVDVPSTSEVQLVPEPITMIVAPLALAALLRRRAKKA